MVGVELAGEQVIIMLADDAINNVLNFAGEITDKYKAKNITLVSSSEKLICPGFTDKFYSTLDYYIESAGVKVHFMLYDFENCV